MSDRASRSSRESGVTRLASLPVTVDSLVRLRQVRRLTAAMEVRSPDVHSFARGFRGRPDDFIAEVMGPTWWGPDWAAWRSFVRTLFARPQAPDELEIFRRCTGLADPPATPQQDAWLPVGRRGGKSRILAMIASYLATCEDWTPYLVPGEQGYIVVLADQRDHAASIMNYIKAALMGHPRLAPLITKVLVESVELLGNITIEVVTASIKAVRSRTVIAALNDEIAFWQSDEDCANPDVEILNGLRPAMATIPGRLMLSASSRYARRGELWNNYRDWYGRVEGPLIWSADTVTMHPGISQSFLGGEFERDPVAAAAEYGLEWRSDVAAFVERDVIEAAVVPGRYELPPVARTRYVAFCDPSGGNVDSMTLAIAHLDRASSRGVLDCTREVRAPFDPSSVTREFSSALKAYGVREVRGDHYGGEWPRAEFRKNEIRYVTSDETKSEIYHEWLPLVNAGRVELLDSPRLVTQACSLERRTRRGGGDSIDHPPGGHDDLINSAAGALVMATASRSPLDISPEVIARSRLPGNPRR